MAIEDIKPKKSWVHQYGFTGQTIASKSQRLDCIYDGEPLGFEKDLMTSTKKMQVHDPLEEVNLGDGPTYISVKIDQHLKV